MTTSEMTIWHNPRCATSRNVLGLIRHAGIEPVVRDYQKDPPSREELLAALAAMGIGPRDLVRQKGTPHDALGLAGADDAALVEAMLAHPILINRPVVMSPTGARLCRPSEVVLELLPRLTKPFVKEDGTVVGEGAEQQGLPG